MIGRVAEALEQSRCSLQAFPAATFSELAHLAQAPHFTHEEAEDGGGGWILLRWLLLRPEQGPQGVPSPHGAPPGGFGFQKKVAGASWPLSSEEGPLGADGTLVGDLLPPPSQRGELKLVLGAGFLQ